MGRIQGATLAFTALLLAAPLANATTYSTTNFTPCSAASVAVGGPATVGAALDAVGLAVETATYMTKSTKDRDNLLIKLAEANSKTVLAKWADAIAKLGDLSATANALEEAAKPKLASADAITAAALKAVQCVSY